MDEETPNNGTLGELPENIQRQTAKRQAALVMSILMGETTAAEAARRHGLTVAEIEEWKDQFLLAAENALRSRPKDEEALREEQIKKLERKVGQLVMDLDIAKEALKLHPFDPGRPTSNGRPACERAAVGLSGPGRPALVAAAQDRIAGAATARRSRLGAAPAILDPALSRRTTGRPRLIDKRAHPHAPSPRNSTGVPG